MNINYTKGICISLVIAKKCLVIFMLKIAWYIVHRYLVITDF